jgi:hypothetical protein
MKAGKLEPIAVVQGGQSKPYAEFVQAAAPAPAPAAEPKKDEPKAEMKKDEPKK